MTAMPEHLSFADYDFDCTPDQIEAIYRSGFPGSVRGEAYRVLLASQAVPFYDAFPLARASGAGRVSLPYRALMALDPDGPAVKGEAQRQGDCVGKCVRNAGSLDYAIDSLFGETTWRGRLCDENIYGMRGHGGEGADCGRLCHYVSPEGAGGFLPRGSYAGPDGGTIDLSIYSPGLSGSWGRRGTPAWLNAQAAANKALRVYPVRSSDEARDAVASGFGLVRCGSDGYSSTRNQDGVSDPDGVWHHAIAIMAVDDTQWAHDQYGGPLWLHWHNWGKWNSGGKRHEQPDGTWWVRSRFFTRWISDGSVWAVASVRGYERELVYDTCPQIRQLSS
jgi:hypothetical protein